MSLNIFEIIFPKATLEQLAKCKDEKGHIMHIQQIKSNAIRIM